MCVCTVPGNGENKLAEEFASQRRSCMQRRGGAATTFNCGFRLSAKKA